MFAVFGWVRKIYLHFYVFISVVYCPPIKSWRNYEMHSTENEFLSVVEYSCGQETQMFEDVKNSKTAAFGDTKSTLCARDKQWDPPLVSCIGGYMTIVSAPICGCNTPRGPVVLI